jgi:L-2-hydroxyglutarate oxidase LhgO
MQPDFDAVVVGARVIGLAIAPELSLACKSVLVLEKGPGPGLETSSRNSEVVHADIYYPKGSLKAQLCVAGSGLLYDYSLPDGLPAKFSGAGRSYWPGVEDRELSPSYCGIRPKIHGPDSGFADFQIQTEASHGIPSLVNFLGIESPGLTVSLAIARLACQLNENSMKHPHKEKH